MYLPSISKRYGLNLLESVIFIHLICSLHIVRQESKEVVTRMIFNDIQKNLYAQLNEEVGLKTLLVIMFIWMLPSR